LKLRGKIICFALFLLIVQCGGKKDDEGVIGENRLPVIDEVTLLPLTPTVHSEITARIRSSDKDGDPVTYQVRWFVNGREIGEGMLFKYDEIEKGDKVFAEVTPYDGKDWGEPKRSTEVTIGGVAPRILSVQIAPESIYVTTPQAVISATVEDPDRDSIYLILHWTVKDALLSDTTNVLKLKQLGLKKHDVIMGTAFAYDGTFRSEPFVFDLTILNAPPIFVTKEDSVTLNPDSIYYQLPIMDPDGDPLEFELVAGPPGVSVDKKTGVVYGNSQDSVAFQIVVRAQDDDGASLEAQFTLTPQ
jgi:hypothetical protein